MSWCMVVHVHAHVHRPHQIYTSQYCTTPTRFCRIWHTSQSGLWLLPKHIEKLTLGLHLLHRKNGPKTPIKTPSFFLQILSLWVVLRLLSRGPMYELWYHNNQDKPILTYNLCTTYHTTYNIHTYHHLHGEELFKWKFVWHLPQDDVLM